MFLYVVAKQVGEKDQKNMHGGGFKNMLNLKKWCISIQTMLSTNQIKKKTGNTMSEWSGVSECLILRWNNKGKKPSKKRKICMSCEKAWTLCDSSF